MIVSRRLALLNDQELAVSSVKLSLRQQHFEAAAESKDSHNSMQVQAVDRPGAAAPAGSGRPGVCRQVE